MSTVYLDLDNVVVNFAKGLLKLVGKTMDDWKVGCWELTDALGEEAESKFRDNQTYDFWYNLEPMPDAKQVTKLVEKFAKRVGYDVAICSAPTHFSLSLAAKFDWLKKHMPRYASPSKCVFTSAKHRLANRDIPSPVLIDDGQHNTDAFNERGGIGVLFPRYFNKDHALPALETLERRLEACEAVIRLQRGGCDANI